MEKLTIRPLLPFLFGLITLVPALGSAQSLLSTDEVADLQYLREEERLARDLYTAFYNLHNSDIFLNIASSEQRHFDAVGNLLNTYGIADPTIGNPDGVFTNSDLQDLYDSLLSQGSDTEANALSMGILVEETDIEDLENAIATSTQSAILRVYRNLLKGSENHLAAFTNRLLQLDSSASVNAGFGPGDGTSVFEPFSQTVYIPAIDVSAKSGAVVVYDAYLRVIESIPVTLELLSISQTDKTANAEHASFSVATGVMNIPSLIVGSQQVDSLNDTTYSAVFHLATGESGGIFVLDSLTPN